MKKVYFSLLVLLTASMILAQAPQAFKYQAIARDSHGNILSNWEINIRISIIQNDRFGDEAYVEVHKVKSNIYGLVDLIIGEGEARKGIFQDVNWADNRHYIKLEMDIDGGENFWEMGTSQLYAVPYALYAEQAGSLVKSSGTSEKSSSSSGSGVGVSGGGNREGGANSKFSADGDSWLNANSGWLGIGTSDPVSKLDIRGFGTDDNAILQLSNTDASHKLVLFPGRENDPNPFIQWKGGDPFRFSTDEGGWSEKMRISNEGNVGIGTIDPQEKLEVNGKVKADNMILKDANGKLWEIQLDTTRNVEIAGVFNQCGDWLYDVRNGQNYKTVQIGTQCWMAENLNVGAQIIKTITGIQQFDNDTIEKYCYDNDIANCDYYGGLYEWTETMQYVSTEGAQGICPDGWHIPTDAEWTALTDYIGGTGAPHGNELKSCRQLNSPLGGVCNTNEHPRWNEDITDYGTDDYGFSGLPGGGSGGLGLFFNSYDGFWWSSTESSSGHAWCRELGSSSGTVDVFDMNMQRGLSVRCLRD